MGFLFDVQENYEENPFIKSVFSAIDTRTLDDSAATSVEITKFFKNADMINFWTYVGSLTYPPCTEGINWTILKQVQKINPIQLKRITDRLAGDKNFAGGKGNNR
jgi:carbonic anhydrase